MLNFSQVKAESIRWVTESWPNYTNEDGSGLYHDIIQSVFMDHELVITYMSWKRALLDVKNGGADMTGATSVVNGYVIPRHAMLAPSVSILFDKHKMTFTDIPTLQNHTAVWASPYEDELIPKPAKPYIHGFSVLNREIAYKMLRNGRADYFLDTKALHQAWLDSLASNPNITLQASDYMLKDISRLKLYMIFTDTPRGQHIKELYDKGMAKLIASGELQKIYEKYGFFEQMPAIPH